MSIEDLTVQFRGDRKWTTAVEGVSFDIGEGDCLGIVGESGSGKSVTALSMLRLHARGTSRFPSGTVRYGGQDLLQAPESHLRQVRGGDIAMVFQDPMSSLNPGADDLRPDLRDAAPASGHVARRCPRPGHRAARPGADRRRAPASRRISASPVGRHAPAGDDRHRHRLPAAAADRGRADDGARCHHPGADPRAAARAADRARHGGDADLARSRRDRRVRRAG